MSAMIAAVILQLHDYDLDLFPEKATMNCKRTF